MCATQSMSAAIVTDASCHSDSGPRGHARWQWWVMFATLSGPPWFNRHFLVQWTALWVIRIPLLPAVASPYNIMEGLCVAIAVVWEQGQLYPHKNTRTHSHSHTHTHVHNSEPPPARHTHIKSAIPFTSVHPCVSNWNMNAFPLGWNRIRLPFPGTLFLTGLASLPTDCPHGYSCCHNTPASSAKSTKL